MGVNPNQAGRKPGSNRQGRRPARLSSGQKGTVAGRTPELEWLLALRTLRAEVYSHSESLPRHCLEASDAIHVAPHQHTLRQLMHRTLPEALRLPWPEPGQPSTLSLLEAMEMILSPVERLMATRAHLLDHLSPVPPLLQALLEQHGIDSTLHRYDVARLVRLVAALPDWLARRGSASAAVALLEALEGQSLSAHIRLPSTLIRPVVVQEKAAGSSRREALDTALEIEVAGQIEAVEALDESSDDSEGEGGGSDTLILETSEADEDEEPLSMVTLLATVTEADPGEVLESPELLTDANEEAPAAVKKSKALTATEDAVPPAPDASATTAEVRASKAGWSMEAKPGEVLVSHGLEWYGHRHDGLPVPASTLVLKGGVVQTLPAFSARFPLAREDVLIALEATPDALLPLLRLLPVWATLRIYRRSEELSRLDRPDAERSRGSQSSADSVLSQAVTSSEAAPQGRRDRSAPKAGR